MSDTSELDALRSENERLRQELVDRTEDCEGLSIEKGQWKERALIAEAALATCQSSEATAYEALTDARAELATAREKALEEAARVCIEIRGELKHNPYIDESARQYAFEQCVDAILDLKGKP